MKYDFPSEIWVSFSGEISNLTAHQIMSNFSMATQNGVKTIHFLIQSAGGVVADGVALYNYLVDLPVELITYNTGSVKSAAVLPFLAGKKRIATDTAAFMIHKAGTVIAERMPAWYLRQRADDLEIDDMNSEKILRKHLAIPEEKWLKYQSVDLTISAQEALLFSLVHEISVFKSPSGGQLFHIS